MYIVITTVLIALFGLAVVSSAMIGKGWEYFSGNFYKQLFSLILAFGVGVFFMRLDYHIFFKHIRLISLSIIGSLGVIFILIIIARVWSLFGGAYYTLLTDIVDLVPFVHYANNAVRWLDLGVIKIQPSEFAKIGLLIVLAGTLNLREKFSWLSLKRFLYLTLASCIMIYFQPDLGSVIVIAVMLFAGLWVSNIDLKDLGVFVAIILGVAVVGIGAMSYRADRVSSWAYLNFCPEYSLDTIPDQDSRDNLCKYFDLSTINQDNIYQTNNIRQSIKSGGWAGKGYQKGDFKQSVPEVTTDGVVSVIGEEGGILGILFFLVAYLFLFLRGVDIARRAKDVGGKVLAAGISTWIIFQAYWNIAGMIGVIPMKGLPLPLVSEGGSSVLSIMIGIGVLLNVSAQSKRPAEKTKIKTKVKHKIPKLEIRSKLKSIKSKLTGGISKLGKKNKSE